MLVGLAVGVPLGVPLGVAVGPDGVSVGLALGLALGVVLGLALGLALGVAFGLVLGVALGLALVVGVVLGVAVDVALLVAVSVGLALGVALTVEVGLAVGVRLCVGVADAVAVMLGVVLGVAVGSSPAPSQPPSHVSETSKTALLHPDATHRVAQASEFIWASTQNEAPEHVRQAQHMASARGALSRPSSDNPTTIDPVPRTTLRQRALPRLDRSRIASLPVLAGPRQARRSHVLADGSDTVQRCATAVKTKTRAPTRAVAA